MTLEEAIMELEYSQQQMRIGNLPSYCQAHYNAIETVLKALEDSIPKKKARKMLDEIDDEIEISYMWDSNDLIIEKAKNMGKVECLVELLGE